METRPLPGISPKRPSPSVYQYADVRSNRQPGPADARSAYASWPLVLVSRLGPEALWWDGQGGLGSFPSTVAPWSQSATSPSVRTARFSRAARVRSLRWVSRLTKPNQMFLCDLVNTG